MPKGGFGNFGLFNFSGLNSEINNNAESAESKMENFKNLEATMSEIMNSVFSCLTKLMENQLPDDFYEQCAEKIKIFKFVKVISKMLNFFNFSDGDSVRLKMQFELLSKRGR